MKFWSKMFAVLLGITMIFGTFAGCGGGGGIKWSGKGVRVHFWGWGDEAEVSVFKKLVDDFNRDHQDEIFVQYKPYSNNGFTDLVRNNLQTKTPADIVYVGDGEFKRLADAGLIEDLSAYIANSELINESEMWETSLNRYRYDVDTTTDTTIDGEPAAVWGIPKDIGPTVIYYNKAHMAEQNITIISVPESELGAKIGTAIATDADGNAVTGKTYTWRGFDAEQRVFNNRVAMSWEETLQLSELLTKRDSKNKVTQYGYFTEWWFAYGWSVGGDCIQYVETDDPTYNGGYWDFTLADDTKNYIVDDNAQPFTINGNTYQPGEILTWQDKLVDTAATTKEIRSEVLAAKENGQLDELPSQKEAFIEFTRLSCKKTATVYTEGSNEYKGYEVTVNPSALGNAGKVGAFTVGKTSMLVDGRWSVVEIRKKAKFDWDVAPLPVYKRYAQDGSVEAHGVASGHSGSTSLAIAKNSKNKDAAWVFLEYIGGRVGQAKQAEAGFAIPNQIDLANSEVFLQTDKKPKNSIVFVEAAAVQKAGDWWYLRTGEWIDDWANYLNGSVRNGTKSLNDFFKSSDFTKTYDLLKEYTLA